MAIPVLFHAIRTSAKTGRSASAPNEGSRQDVGSLRPFSDHLHGLLRRVTSNRNRKLGSISLSGFGSAGGTDLGDADLAGTGVGLVDDLLEKNAERRQQVLWRPPA